MGPKASNYQGLVSQHNADLASKFSSSDYSPLSQSYLTKLKEVYGELKIEFEKLKSPYFESKEEPAKQITEIKKAPM